MKKEGPALILNVRSTEVWCGENLMNNNWVLLFLIYRCSQVDLTVCFSGEPDAVALLLRGLCWIIFEIVQKPRVVRKVNEVANEGWYSENHWGFSEGTMEKQVATYDSKYGFLKTT